MTFVSVSVKGAPASRGAAYYGLQPWGPASCILRAMPAPVDLADHVLFVILAAVLGPRAWLTFRRLRAAPPDEQGGRRPRAYRNAMITQWTLSLALLAHWGYVGRAWGSLGVVPRITPGAIGVAAGLVVMTGLMLLQSRGAEGRARARANARARMRPVAFLLPHTPHELRLFTALSITAGVCEELLFRGFMIWYLAHWTGELQAALISSLLFGLGHMYQGLRGILLTGGIGAFLSGIYLVSGSLVLPVVVHAMVDVLSGRTGYDLLREGAEAEEDPAGASPQDGTPA
jgi:membrane protease YdiL (CAAX protease family)